MRSRLRCATFLPRRLLLSDPLTNHVTGNFTLNHRADADVL
jgi:hypothetical protein